jgi:hypothetical protein
MDQWLPWPTFSLLRASKCLVSLDDAYCAHIKLLAAYSCTLSAAAGVFESQFEQSRHLYVRILGVCSTVMMLGEYFLAVTQGLPGQRLTTLLLMTSSTHSSPDQSMHSPPLASWGCGSGQPHGDMYMRASTSGGEHVLCQDFILTYRDSIRPEL